MAPLELFPFRFRDPVTGKWQRARYVAALAEISSRYEGWELIGPAEVRADEPMKMFTPHHPWLEIRATDRCPELATTIDAAERFLVRLFLRRYATWCARKRRFAQMQGAARLHEQIV